MHEATESLPEYWKRSDRFYNFKDNVRGSSHVLATVDETTYSGGKMKALADHPVAWCKDFEGGRSFYTNAGANGDLTGADVRSHLAGAVQWAAGEADPVYSDCGATVLANYQQTKVSVNPNLNEPIGFDVLPDGRLLQTARGGQLRLHDPKDDSSKVIATLPVYTNSEDGLYGPAVDNDFADQPLGLPLLRAADGRQRQAVRRDHPHDHDAAEQLGADDRPVAERVGRLRRLLPAQPLQVRRRIRRDPALAGPRLRAEDPARQQQPRRVLSRRG